ncbi:MAG: hypothetical protein KME49_27770 [Brasilonema octagenarum HA4186-MV1]|jgi:hypothetical protein|uniref:Uncharacterized protein n=2 Tax=Brasilonema TaxID=383614 RepID=A0A856MMN4_9CYAN|nr:MULTISPECIES: hypothetical protein [Brasilonema]MBW4629204.1 hypothetical protein [Brasilonema octagenarum HA4186-MV1]NMF65268.1 hypothetical protein [Brasilonema octagenarum UFV-OR1]QDL11669.1 hypothetical protein DP114_30625 [Brasilonema sennae CENA114]QDL18048.1 hypothetical protein DP113_30760 [Brasilonema octagenarum UFV-E1]
MKHWQFLIQKQGDRSWSPIESPNIEIVEGRYRVLARSDLINTDLQVQITHSSTMEFPPKRRIQKRSRSTNSEGLIALLPFSYLKPGVWEFCCSGDLMSHFVDQPWQHCIQLKVLPIVVIEVGRQQEDTRLSRVDKEQFPVFSDELLEEAMISQPISPVWLKGEKTSEILQNLIEIALPDSQLAAAIEDFCDQTLEPPLVLKLQEDFYTVPWGQTLTINGRVEEKETTNLDHPLRSNYQRVYAGEIRIELRSPQDSKIIRRVRLSLSEKFIPFPIRCSIEVPADCESKLILGEISLYGILTVDGKTTLLTNQFFTMTADVTELLAISATAKKNELDTIEHQPVSSKLSTPLDLQLFNLVKTPTKAKSHLLQPSPKKSLPPKIEPPLRRLKSAAVSPQLPSFVQHQNRIISPAAVCEASPNLESNRQITSKVIRMETTLPYLRRVKLSQNETKGIMRYESVDEQQDTTEIHNEDAAKSVIEQTQYQISSFDEDAAKDNAQPQDTLVKLVIPHNSQLFTTGNPDISPLIIKWMHTQGYSLPEPINLQNQDDDIYFVASQDQMSDEVNKKTQKHGDAEDLHDNSREGAKEGELSALPHSFTPPSSQPPNSLDGKVLSARLVHEIVVEDIFDETEPQTFKNQPSKQKEESISDVSVGLPVLAEITEPLPVPQLHLSSGELISGKFVRIRIQLAPVADEVAVKLWILDCQTRGLIDEPRWLTHLRLNPAGVLEEITHLRVPFGCLEIRLEAMAVNKATQQESHKVSILRSVIPPDLPNLQLNEVFGV